MKNYLYIFGMTAFLVFALQQNGMSQQLRFEFKNPSFGGNPLNGSWMFSQAQATNFFQDDGLNDFGFDTDPIQDFKESLNRQILNEISRSLIDDTFGTTGLSAGTYELGDYNIEITNTLEGIQILILDITTGNQTSLIIPYL